MWHRSGPDVFPMLSVGDPRRRTCLYASQKPTSARTVTAAQPGYNLSRLFCDKPHGKTHTYTVRLALHYNEDEDGGWRTCSGTEQDKLLSDARLGPSSVLSRCARSRLQLQQQQQRRVPRRTSTARSPGSPRAHAHWLVALREVLTPPCAWLT
ncbi:hypothetical protein WMY93_001679 [Mugilogobius chulae]|uniref:Uncharacterized protein n=1 Tax=Mugilogobius chulae TaxID=88201 RepID=A0AAW0PSP7_9GOBI